MPGPKVQASQGGISPTKETKRPVTNPCKLLRMRQPTLQSPVEEQQRGSKEQAEESQQGAASEDSGTWVLGATSDENEKYKIFLQYCEERREEARLLQQGDEERMKGAKEKRRHWNLLRETIKYLRENDARWTQRKLKETARIRAEEKADRLAIVAEKKKRYGLTRLSKEENRRLKERTEDKVTLAQARGNYWKHYRDKRDEDKEETAEAWERLKESIIALEDETINQHGEI